MLNIFKTHHHSSFLTRVHRDFLDDVLAEGGHLAGNEHIAGVYTQTQAAVGGLSARIHLAVLGHCRQGSSTKSTTENIAFMFTFLFFCVPHVQRLIQVYLSHNMLDTLPSHAPNAFCPNFKDLSSGQFF